MSLLNLIRNKNKIKLLRFIQGRPLTVVSMEKGTISKFPIPYANEYDVVQEIGLNLTGSGRVLGIDEEFPEVLPGQDYKILYDFDKSDPYHKGEVTSDNFTYLCISSKGNYIRKALMRYCKEYERHTMLGNINIFIWKGIIEINGNRFDTTVEPIVRHFDDDIVSVEVITPTILICFRFDTVYRMRADVTI